MIRLDVPQSVERELKANAVRLPSVSPEKRYAREKNGYKREYTQALFNDSQKKAADSVIPDAGRPTTIFEAQKGLLLESRVVMERLQRLNPNLVFQRSIARPEWVGIYVRNTRPEYLPEGLEFLGITFTHGKCPEFSVKSKTEDYVAHDGKIHSGECTGIPFPGWRNALARLIKKRLITEAGAELLFGLPTNQSAFWAASLGKRSA